MKTYMDYLNEISDLELYRSLLGFGMFSEKIPPIFSSKQFAEYCIEKDPKFMDKPKQYVYYENMRNINIPRPLGIPVPMAYQKLVCFIAKHWSDLKQHFDLCTNNQKYKISRIHIRKFDDQDSVFSSFYEDENNNEEERNKYASKLFEMNQNNWKNDGAPEDSLIFGKKYVVHADISKCFQSIYTHSLPWALVGRSVAKQNKGQKKEWYNILDHLIQNNKDGETHGLIIGPHASNLLSEIILCQVDKTLVDQEWEYVRKIDDYTCYVEDENKAEAFLVALQTELRKYDLTLNHKKTRVNRLPEAMVESWVRKIKGMQLLTSYGKVDYKNCQSYLDFAIEVFKKEKENSAVLTYAIKTLSGMPLTDNAKTYEKNIVFHLCLSYPYLVTLMEDFVFTPCKVDRDEIKDLARRLFDNGIKNRTYEQCSYALYFSIRYDFNLDINSHSPTIIATEDCVLLTIAYVYFMKYDSKDDIKKLKNYASSLKNDNESFERMWLFVYEILPKADLRGDWKVLKNNDITFLKRDFS